MNRFQRTRRSLLALGGAAWAFPRITWGQAEPPKPAQIVVNDSGGDMQNAMRSAFYSEYEKRYGIKVVSTSPVDLGKLRAMVQSGNVEWQVTEIDGESALLAEKSGPARAARSEDHRPLAVSEAPAEPQVRVPEGRLFDGDGLPHRRLPRGQAAAELGGLLGRAEIPRTALDAQRSGRQPGVRVARRRRASRQDLSDRRRPRVPQDGPDQEIRDGLVDDRRRNRRRCWSTRRRCSAPRGTAAITR